MILLTTNIQAQNKVWSQLRSPNKLTAVQLATNGKGELLYKMDFKGKAVIEWSNLGLETDEPNMANHIAVAAQVTQHHHERFAWPLGEDAVIDNDYNETIIHCQSSNAKFEVYLRLYNGSLAFKYVYPNAGNKTVSVKKELTTFNLASPYKIYQYHEESTFNALPVDSLPGISDLPSTLVNQNRSLYLSIGEAENLNFTKSVLIKGSRPGSLALTFYMDTVYRDQKVQHIKRDTLLIFKNQLITPWRTVSCSETAIGLHQFSQLGLRLVKPLTTAVPQNIKPGKVFRVQINTQSGLDGVDFARKMNFQYIMFDAGWYGPEYKSSSDPTRWIPELDLPKVLAHAKENGIGVILYVNYIALKAKLDTILPLYKKWGVSGLKFGFIDGGTQWGLSWLDTAVKKVNEYGFVLNIHDHYKPTGLSRRYPYNLSQEGIRGDENSPDAYHNTVLPFTRFLAGPADFTFCFPNPSNSYSKNIKVSKAQQLALTVVYFDPLQSIFWYGRSNEYTNDREIEFFKYVPTVWDESHYVAGEIGEHITVARRKEDVWFVGTAAGFSPIQQTLKLDFLKKNQAYLATIYSDDANQSIGKRTVNVKWNDTLPLNINAKGGQAIIIRPAN
ncbi:glycoside hydrolase family 97 catalytic domain-containing protein [Mucilaginibacter sp. PAMB04274]|uniref:glycoside hydrolase family 97 protein n=1 Tax=Mucilaginibacter sp. PAMB04274 TaxID=3138568 RepID=UPI0031F62A84